MEISPEIRRFIERNTGPVSGVEPVPGHASARTYYRVHTGIGTVILCRDDSFTGVPLEEYPFYIVYSLLKETVPVPEVIGADPGLGILLLEDLGDDILETVYPKLDDRERLPLFREILSLLGEIQSVTGDSPVPFALEFDAEKLMCEFRIFIEHCLKGFYGAEPGADELTELENAFLDISRILDRPELFVLNHRDFQSRNIMIHGGRPWIVDFQDARMGLPQYDLVSLAYDDYISLDDGFRQTLLNDYRELSRERGLHSMDRDLFDYYADITAFQRNIKVGGTFSFLLREKKLPSYGKLVATTLSHVKMYVSRRRELQLAYGILKRHIPLFE